MGNDAIARGNIALVTGGATGIGRAAALQFAKAGMSIVIADVRTELFAETSEMLSAAGAASVMTQETDVADRAALTALKTRVDDTFGGVNLLMCNAGIGLAGDVFDSEGSWEAVLGVNLFGVTQTCQVFIPDMINSGAPGMVINTGSKQGITTPPGNPVYNLSKAGVKVYTEALAHHLREVQSRISAHLLVPGHVFTDLTRRGRTEKPPIAWTPEQTVDFMMPRLAANDFYIICPDNEVPWALDQKRIAWSAGDIIENRPALSRWHKDYVADFDAFIKK